ncbi:unnamed protein product [Ixodes pacificus]
MFLPVDRRNTSLYNRSVLKSGIDNNTFNVLNSCSVNDSAVLSYVDDDCVIEWCDEVVQNAAAIKTQDDLCKSYIRACNRSTNDSSFLNYNRILKQVVTRTIYERRLQANVTEKTTPPWYIVRILGFSKEFLDEHCCFKIIDDNKHLLCVFDPKIAEKTLIRSSSGNINVDKLHFSLYESDRISVLDSDGRVLIDCIVLCKIYKDGRIRPSVHLENLEYNDSAFIQRLCNKKSAIYRPDVGIGGHPQFIQNERTGSIDEEKKGTKEKSKNVCRLLQCQKRKLRRRGGRPGHGGLFCKTYRCDLCTKRRDRRTERALSWRLRTLGCETSAVGIRKPVCIDIDRDQTNRNLHNVFFRYL